MIYSIRTSTHLTRPFHLKTGKASMLSESEAAQTVFPDVTGSSVGVEEFGCPQISVQEQETAFRSVLSLRERWRDCIELLEALKDWLRFDQPIRKSLQFLLVVSRLKISESTPLTSQLQIISCHPVRHLSSNSKETHIFWSMDLRQSLFETQRQPH